MKNIIKAAAIILGVQGMRFIDFDVDKSILRLEH